MKYKIVRSEHRKTDETILEADDLDELSRMLNAKTGSDLGLNLETTDGVDLGFGDDDGGLL
jgi:hypothetical protein